MKKRITSILNNKHSERFIIALIIFNIIIFNCGGDKLFTDSNYWYIEIFDQFSMIIFTFEYLMRAFTLDKTKDLFRPLLMLDLIALLPYYLAFLPFKTTFFRLLTGCGDFCPAANFGRILDSVSVIIFAGIHCLIIDVVAPAFLKFVRQIRNQKALALEC